MVTSSGRPFSESESGERSGSADYRGRGGVTAIPGLHELWLRTTGSLVICIAVLDGPVDLTHPAFRGADVELLAFGTKGSADDAATRHGTHVASVIFGQHGSPVAGVAPRCRGVIIPIFESGSGDAIAPCSQYDLARALLQAVEYGAKVINVSGGEYSPSGTAHPILAEAVERCAREGVLIVAAAGNDGCRCVHVPGSLPSVLSVGAMDSAGRPYGFSNWGDHYRSQGVIALGQDVLGAAPAGLTAARTGTSFATPIVSGVVGLLLHLQQLAGSPPNVWRVKDAILRTARRNDCDPEGECNRLLAGRLNIAGASQFILEGTPIMNESDNPLTDRPQAVEAAEFGGPPAESVPLGPSPLTSMVSLTDGVPGASPPGAAVLPSDCGCGCGRREINDAGGGPQLVFALGRIGYDFQTEARRDTIIANMEVPQGLEQGNPFDPRQLLAYLERNPSEAARITWTLNHDATPIYAIHPLGAFAADAYKILVGFLRDQLEEGVEVVSIPGVIVGKTRLFTGNSVPVVAPEIRGMFSWTIAKLLESVLSTYAEKAPAGGAPASTEGDLRESMENFLRRIYFEFRNLGLMAQDRAINFAGTQVFRIVRFLERQQRRGFQLDTVEVKRSPICRPESDCWDVRIIFFDPENVLRARSAFLVTVDVSDSVPVMISDGVREFAER